MFVARVDELEEQHGAVAVACHNHPSAVQKPSQADELISAPVKEALALIGVRLVDHLIVADRELVRFAACGLI